MMNASGKCAIKIAVMLVAAGCRAPVDLQTLHADLTARAAATISLVDLYKPNHAGSAGLDPYMAPFILQAVPAGGGAAPAFGAVTRAAEGLQIDTNAPAVYFRRRDGLPQPTVAFAWFYRSPAGAMRTQGLRMTMGTDGIPILYEALSGPQAGRPAFVTLGRADEQPVLPPDAIVVGYRAAPPEPMGPHVYVDAESLAITDVHCRCEPTHFEAVRADRLYELLPAEALEQAGVSWPWPR